MQGGFLLDVVIAQRSSVFQLLSSEDQSLLFRWDSLFVLNLGLDILNGVIGLNIQRNRLSRQGLDEDLHRSSSESQHQVQRRLLLDVVIRQGSGILQLFPCEDQSLLFRWNSLFILNFGLDVLDRVVRLDIQRNRFARQGLDEDLHGHCDLDWVLWWFGFGVVYFYVSDYTFWRV